MKYSTVFHLISSEFQEANIPCVLVGGFAVNYYGVTRQTADVDLLIDKEDVTRAVDVLEKAGYTRGPAQEAFARLEGRTGYLVDIDLMLVDRNTLVGIMEDGKEITIAGQRFVVPSLNHLVALKLHAVKYNPGIREFKDLPDIISLLKANAVDAGRRGFREMCLKYGTEDLYRKIMDAMGESIR